MKITIVDPHLTNFVFSPVKSFFDKTHRIPKKYNYLVDALYPDGIVQIYFRYDNSSIFGKRRIKNISTKLFKLLVFVETFIWAKLNKIKINRVKDLRGNILFFGNSELIKWEFIDLLCQENDIKQIYIHLTHYFTFPEKKNIFHPKILFLSDFDISTHSIFIKKFPLYQNKIVNVPFSIRDHFYEYAKLEKKFNLLMIGSASKYSLSEKKIPILSIDENFKTIHPIRLELANKDFGSKVLNHITLLTEKGLGDHFRKYLSFDLKKLFSMSHYVLCPSEGSGLIGISTLEAMASGCGIIISEYDLRLLKLDRNTEGVIVYKDYDDLLIKIKQISDIEIKPFETKKLQSKALQYNRKNLIKSIDLK